MTNTHGSQFMKKTATGKVMKATLYIPKDPLRHQARKVQQLMHILDGVALTNPEKLNVKDYLAVIARYKEISEEINKRDKNKKIEARMDKHQLAGGGTESDETDVFSE